MCERIVHRLTGKPRSIRHLKGFGLFLWSKSLGHRENKANLGINNAQAKSEWSCGNGVKRMVQMFAIAGACILGECDVGTSARSSWIYSV